MADRRRVDDDQRARKKEANLGQHEFTIDPKTIMVVKLYGSEMSTCTKRVAVTLHEKQVPFQFFNIDLMKGEHKSPAYLEKQPFGQVPYLDDDGFIIYESRAIAYYIAKKWEKQGTPLIPTNFQSEALFHQAACVEMSDFNEYAEKAVAEVVFKRMRGVQGDKATFDRLIKSLSAKLDVYDKILANQDYVAGKVITLADLYHLPYGSMLAVAGSNIMQEKPNVKRWFDNIYARESWQAVKDGVKGTA